MNEEYTYDIGKYTIGVDKNGEDGIGLTVAIINDNGEIHLLGNCYGDNARCIDLLIKENQQLKEQVEYLRRSVERKEEIILDLRNENTLHSDEYVSNLEKENQQLKEKLKDAIKYVKKTSGYDNPYNDTFLNTYAVDNLLEILDKGE